MFKAKGVNEPKQPSWPDDDSILRIHKRFSPEQQLLYAFLMRNISDLVSPYQDHRISARQWFNRSMDYNFSWPWVATHLGLSSRTVSRIHKFFLDQTRD